MAPPQLESIAEFAAASAIVLLVLVCVALLRGEYRGILAPRISHEIIVTRHDHPKLFWAGLTVIAIFTGAMIGIAIYEVIGPLGPFGANTRPAEAPWLGAGLQYFSDDLLTD